MTFASMLALSVGLAMDAMAAAMARGAASVSVLASLKVRHVALVGLFFGGFQALMPLLGWALGAKLGPLVAAWDHWIAFALLSAVGLKMLHESRKKEPDDADAPPKDGEAFFGLRILLVLAVATSIDALAVGFTLPMLDAALVPSLATIGITTALLSMIGLVAGRRFGGMFGSRLDAIGGLVLLALGVKFLVEHFRAS